jgi:hypothetical protein
MTRGFLFLLAVSLYGQTTFSDFAVDIKSHSTARIGWTTDGVISDWNLEWDTQATPLFANVTSYRNESSGPTWYYGYFTAGNPTSIYVPYGHGCKAGYKLLVSGATGGWARLNGVRTCTYTGANHFTLDADTTGASGNTIGAARYLRWEQALAGLPANTTIYYRVCQNKGSSCSAVQSFRTNSEPSEKYPDPTLPAASGALTSPPASFARTEVTVSSCDGLQSAIDAALSRGETGDVLLPIHKGLHCSFSGNPGLNIGKNTNTGYLVIRPDSADSELPPDGVRISTDWEASMVTLSAGSFGAGRNLVQLTSTNRIYLMGIIFENDFPTSETKAITSVKATSPLVYTATGHGFIDNEIVQIREVRGVSGANVTNCKVQNATTRTFECKGSSGTGVYTSGGYAVKTPPIAPSALYGHALANIVIDRCIIRHVWPAMGQAGAIWFSGTEGSSGTRNADINLINSYVYNVNDWVPVDPDTGERATCCSNPPYEGMLIIAADRVLMQNNKLDIPGISVFDDGGRITDLTFRRNLNDWNTAWKYSGAGTNWPVTVRQQFEMKSCFRCLLDGNQWLNQWRGGFGQGTGGYNVSILFSGRSGYDGFTGEYGFGDLTITNNLIANAPGGISIGNAGGYQYDQKPIRNVLIRNNLMYGISWGQVDATSNGTTQYGAPAFLVLGGPFENLRIENNTLWDNRRWNSPYSPWNAGLSFLGGPRGAYLRFHNNFLAHNPDGAYDVLVWPSAGAEILPAPVASGTGILTSKFLHDVDFNGNIAVPGVTNSRLEANYTDPSKNYPQAACASYWAGRSGVTCHAGNVPTAYGNFATIGFVDYANHDFRLKASSRYASGGAGRGSDDTNVGADADALDRAVGKVKNVHVREISSSGAALSYTAPDTDACTVEYGPSAAWGTGSRFSDWGGDRARNVTLGGLSGARTYYYRVLCAAEQPSGNIQTPAVAKQPSGNIQTPGAAEQPSGNIQAPGVAEQPSGNIQTPGAGGPRKTLPGKQRGLSVKEPHFR